MNKLSVQSRVQNDWIDNLHSMLNAQVGYSASLQRAIEHHCRGKLVPDVIAKECPHHAEMLNASLQHDTGDDFTRGAHDL